MRRLKDWQGCSVISHVLCPMRVLSKGPRGGKQAPSSAAKTKRTPGRPVSAGAPDAKEAIIQAAERLLKDNLPSQVTNSMIAREAGADPALIRYYFGDRASLFMAVVENMFASNRE